MKKILIALILAITFSENLKAELMLSFTGDTVNGIVDKFTDDYSLKGLAFRFGDDNVDVGNSGSRIDSNTYNITYYSTSPVQDDTKLIDKKIAQQKNKK